MTPCEPFTERERYIIVEEIGKMNDIPFGAAVELVDQVLGGAIFSMAGEEDADTSPREPPNAEYLGRLIYQVAARQDLPQEDRRLLISKIAYAGSEADRAHTAGEPGQGLLPTLRAPARGRNTVTGEEVELPLPLEDLMVTFRTGSLEPFRALLGDRMYENVGEDDPGDLPRSPHSGEIKSDIDEGEEYDDGEETAGGLTFEKWEWDGTEVKVTPLSNPRKKEP